jgi:hypothetical protein
MCRFPASGSSWESFARGVTKCATEFRKVAHWAELETSECASSMAPCAPGTRTPLRARKQSRLVWRAGCSPSFPRAALKFSSQRNACRRVRRRPALRPSARRSGPDSKETLGESGAVGWLRRGFAGRRKHWSVSKSRFRGVTLLVWKTMFVDPDRRILRLREPSSTNIPGDLVPIRGARPT